MASRRRCGVLGLRAQDEDRRASASDTRADCVTTASVHWTSPSKAMKRSSSGVIIGILIFDDFAIKTTSDTEKSETTNHVFVRAPELLFCRPARHGAPVAFRQLQDNFAVALAGATKGPKMFNHLRIQPHVAFALRVARVLVAHETEGKRKRSGDGVKRLG